MTDIHDVVVIGGGQAGLAMARCLQHRGIQPLVLDAGERPGDAWRGRYDSLVLFTPSQYASLPDTPFPLPPDAYPTKDQAADYLASYATTHAIDVRSRCRVTRLCHEPAASGGFVLETERGEEVRARQVVVATGALQRPAVPELAAGLSGDVFQLHTSAYRNPASIPEGPVLIVGAGNSGAQIAEELCREREVTIAFEALPRRFPQRFLGRDIFWWFLRMGVMDRSRENGRTSSDVVGAIPLIGSRLPALLRSGTLARCRRVVGAKDAAVQLADGSWMPVASVLWATGFRNDFSWIDAPSALDGHGRPLHHRGVSQAPGLYFLGLPGLHTKGSAFLGFVGRDAAYLAPRIEGRMR